MIPVRQSDLMASDQDHWLNVQDLFEKACEFPAESVDEFLNQACGDDDALKHEVQELLAAFDDGEAALEPPARSSSDDRFPLPQTSIPGYELLDELHRGGQGTVYRALQRSTKREVALKFMLSGHFADDATKRRFEREVELVRGLRHPGIVPVFDSGLADDQYFYAMEFVDGVHLDQFVNRNSLKVRDTLSLFTEICEAVNHAQQRGVVHRDLKPSNILVDPNGKPRVLDFGLAKSVTTESRLTVSMTGQVMGTLAYMSPEQAAGANDEVDTRTDVYSLGVVLFELLTGDLPYPLDFSLAENLSAIKNVQPDSQALKRHRIDGEVSTILLKALHKEKDRRYASAGAMGEDIKRYLRGEPIEAKRDSSLYVIRKVLRRNYKAALACAAFLGLLIVSSVVSFGLFLSADSARQRANRNASLYESERDEVTLLRDEGLAQLYVAEMNLAGQGLERTGGIRRIKQLTGKWAISATDKDYRNWEWYFLQSHCDQEAAMLDHSEWVWCLQWHPSENRLAFGDNKGDVWLWRPDDEPQLIGRVPRQIRGLAWNQDGSRLAVSTPGGAVVVFSVEGRKRLHTISHEEEVLTVAWHPRDPNRMAFADLHGGLQIWDVAANEKIAQWEMDTQVQAIQWPRQGREIVAACIGRKVQVWNVKKQALVAEFADFDHPVFGAALHPGGALIAACDVGGGIALFDRKSDARRWTVDTERMNTAVSWSPDGDRFASVGSDRLLRLYDRGGTLLDRFDGHTNGIWSVSWNADGSMIATGGRDQSIRLWKPDQADRSRVSKLQPGRPSSYIYTLDWHPDGRTIAVAGQAYETFLFEPDSLSIARQLRGRQSDANTVRWSPQGDRIAAGGHDNRVTIWDVESGDILLQFDKHTENQGGEHRQIHSLCWSTDGNQIASGCQRGNVYVWDAHTGEVLAAHRERSYVRTIDWHPFETRLLIAAPNDGTLKSWEPFSSKPPRKVSRFEGGVTRARWSPDGKQIAACSNDGTVQIFDGGTYELQHTLSDHTGGVTCVDWNPDSTRIVTGSYDLTLKIWDVRRGVQTLSFVAHDRSINAVVWSPDGMQIVSGGDDSVVKIWDATTGYRRASEQLRSQRAE
ncbi:MAG: protein kinase [Planctomycetota bacterium]